MTHFSNRYLLVEWEWIPQVEENGVYLRNKVTKQYFCFNKRGRPVAKVSYPQINANEHLTDWTTLRNNIRMVPKVFQK